MNVHVLMDTTFFATSIPIADGQRLLPVPPSKGLHVGDTVFLRDDSGTLTWVGNVLAGGETAAVSAWSNDDENRQRHAIVGYLARIHPDALPRGTSKLSARWVTLNKRTLPTTLPWWDDHLLVYHSTLRIVEGIFTPDQIQRAASRGYLNKHPSGHWAVPHGEARKRIMVEILGVDLVCGLCGGPIDRVESATQDHIIPISQGGPDTLANVQLAHRACNELKGNALPEQYPPFFPQPGDRVAGWYGRTPRPTRGGRGRGGRHGRDNRPGNTGFQVESRELSVASGSNAAEQSNAKPKTGSPAAVKRSSGKQETPAEDKGTLNDRGARAEAAATAETETKRAAGRRNSGGRQSGGKQTGKAEAPKNGAKDSTAKGEPVKTEENGVGDVAGQEKHETPAAPVSAEELAWLADVQAAGLERLQAFAKEPNWAARTASLRTLAQLPRGRAGKARAQGQLLADANGPKGKFQLLHWEDQHILVEERGRRQTVHLVHMCAAISPDAYVSYLTHFGRTSPLAVILALTPLWQKGTPDDEGRLTAAKSNVQLVIAVADDRIVQCSKEPGQAAS